MRGPAGQLNNSAVTEDLGALFRLVPSAMPHSFDKIRILMADEVLKWRGLPVFLAHEDQRQKGRKEHDTCRDLRRLEINEVTEPLAVHAIADLVMILGENDEALPAHAF